ncbi:Hsp20/alpha crystallin family protein [Azotobacter beijerinckii]|uniref:Heat shock protein Hsp20 n=1 Tax=Azotobacter beijerinckii TaxID=170623 RepID=A0A1I4G179_9GAMM|nr:Hsp20/alpha crystallin family protein [Azotobacter beijerinckii]SFB49021.1 heat shock protein Hsp20 [Azotobacter beijerinckii]SFL23280.1 heat shock protein Hsp20 [Azotobacter beijerinckii]
MADTEKQVPASSAPESRSPLENWHPLDRLRRQVDHLFSDFSRKALRTPFTRNLFDSEPQWSRELFGQGMPAVDINDKGAAYEISAELPGMDEKDIEVKLSSGCLTIRGEKKEAREDKKKDAYVAERYYGAFQRSFALPQEVDAERIEANFSKGVLTLSLPKKPEALADEKTIEVKTG